MAARWGPALMAHPGPTPAQNQGQHLSNGDGGGPGGGGRGGGYSGGSGPLRPVVPGRHRGRGTSPPHSGIVPLAEPPAKRQKTYDFKVKKVLKGWGLTSQ